MRSALLLILALSFTLSAAAQENSAAPGLITLDLCATDAASHEWSESLSGLLQEILQSGQYPKDLKIELKSEGKPCQEPLFPCHTVASTMRCDEQSINRLLQASAWLSAHDTQQMVRLDGGMPLKRVLDEVGEMDFHAALQIVDAMNDSDPELAASILKFHRLRNDLKDLVADLQHADSDPSYNPHDELTWTAGPIFAVASSELVGLLFGHELAHAMESCHLHVPSSVERSGLFERLVSMQARGTGFVRETPSTDEISADRCALRVLELVDGEWVKLSDSIPDPQGKSAAKEKTRAGRRIALDAFATLLAYSSNNRTTNPRESMRVGLYKIAPAGSLMNASPEGYLYPALRLALAATVLNDRQASDDPVHKIILCELVAEQFVSMLQIAGDLKDDKKSPEFADLFGTILAPGVTAGLRSGVWHNANPGSSFTCDK